MDTSYGFGYGMRLWHAGHVDCHMQHNATQCSQDDLPWAPTQASQGTFLIAGVYPVPASSRLKLINAEPGSDVRMARWVSSVHYNPKEH